jgi:hypothetical protein
MDMPTGRPAVDELDSGDLDDSMPQLRIQSGCLGI